MMTPTDRQPIIVADAGPLIRLAAAGLLDALRGLNRRIVLVDRIEDEVIGDMSKPFASAIAAWIHSMGEAILHVETATGHGISTLRARRRTPQQDRLLKSALRAGELALREFLGHWRPTETGSAIVVYEDRKVVALFLEADFLVTITTIRKFAETITEWGINIDATRALEAVAEEYDLKPAMIAEIDPDTPTDLRELPRPYRLE